MKKTIAFLTALTLMTGAALAESQQIPTIPENTIIEADLDGDGTPESVSWKMAASADFDPTLTVYVMNPAAGLITYETHIWSASSVYAADLNQDGITELLVSGDEMSDDYVTLCLHLENGALNPVSFTDANRGENLGEPLSYGYGMLTSIDGNRLTLSGSQDVLGTWFGHRIFTLTDAGTFDFADEGEWVRDIDLPDSELWEYAALTLKTPINCTAADGSEMQLSIGDQILITASDKQTYAKFILKDGTEGRLPIAPDTENGWGNLVSGISENDAFEYIPYAD